MEKVKSGREERESDEGSLSNELLELKVSDIADSVNIPQELFTIEILTRLPVRCLFRFKTVCKEWNTIISSPEFARLQLDFSQKNPSNTFIETLVLETDNGIDILKLTVDGEDAWDIIPFQKCDILFVDDEEGIINVVGSCNGMVCLWVEDPEMTFSFFIWNPCIKDFFEVMFPGFCCPTRMYGGFGYVASEDDYKIFAYGISDIPDEEFAFVHSLRDNTWTELPHFAQKYVLGDKDGILVNETLYWRGHDGRVTGFNLEDYTCQEVSTTQWNSAGFCCSGVFALGGSLCAWGCERANRRDIVEIWMLEQQQSSCWVKLFNLNIAGVVSSIEVLLGYTKSGKILAQVGYINGELLVVDPIIGDPVNFVTLKGDLESLVSFTESLISPYHYLSIN